MIARGFFVHYFFVHYKHPPHHRRSWPKLTPYGFKIKMIPSIARFTSSVILIFILLIQSKTGHAQTTEPKLQALIIDGQNNHAVWPKSTVMLKQYLEETGLFDVDVERTKFTWRGEREKDFLPLAGVEAGEDLQQPKSDPTFAPSFKNYDVVISNFGNKTAAWPKETQSAFQQYMKSGGGFVTVHAADNAFGDWPEYNKIIGIGGWGNRKSKSGTYVYYNNQGELVRADADGKVGGHGPQHNIPISLRTEHPITEGLPQNWLSAKDECYSLLSGPAENMTILATGKDASGKAPTDRHEPMLMVLDYGEGRIFHTTLGHESYSLEGVGFITTFQRGCQWAATGDVTLPVPDDFPTHEKSSSRPFRIMAAAAQEN